MAVSKRVRYEVLRRDEHRCRYCGSTAEDGPLTVDHVVPVALGGSDDPSNLVAACRDCNAGKSSTNPDDQLVAEVDELTLRLADALELVTIRRHQHRERLEEDRGTFGAYWDDWTVNGKPIPRAGGWEDSIERFLTLGLDLEDLLRFLRIAMNSRAKVDGVWSYFCGICWNEVRDRQDEARQMVADTLTRDVLGEEEIL